METVLGSNTCSAISQPHGLEQVTYHLWILVFSFVIWREYHPSGSVVVRFKERSAMTNLKAWQAINKWYFKKYILIVIQIAQARRREHTERKSAELFGAFETSSWSFKNSVLWFIFSEQQIHVYVFSLSQTKDRAYLCTVCTAFILYLTAYLGDFSRLVYDERLHFYFVESQCSTELMFYHSTSPC